MRFYLNTGDYRQVIPRFLDKLSNFCIFYKKLLQFKKRYAILS
ncbi:hypothetical protein CLOSTHATH_02455 [Hungatella hathewayi DSM 13479]|uniref:Uncharacterized protein n=1 Tax=Hungatella hathewayi DSM 13479 TaxID=566550 RepID=D3AFR9_9FIRM|nr:hypothetical protein CLOSTHATH_02455 [Hungatella hathewayi DSM 13479]